MMQDGHLKKWLIRMTNVSIQYEKIFMPVDTYSAALARLRYLFSEFENVYVAFSGGKDSGVMLNLVIQFLRDEMPGRKVGVYHLDYEGQYDSTTEYVTEVMTSNLDVIEPHWCCMPIAAQCATSMYQDHWTPWHPEQQAIWTRSMPDYPSIINWENHSFGDKFRFDMQDYDFDGVFHDWYREKCGGGKTICLVGERTQESLHRYSAIVNKVVDYDGHSWISTLKKGRNYSAKPIYDWDVKDVWIANARFCWRYNRMYDLMYLAGVPLNDMRVASPFNDCAIENLHLYRALEPNTWSRLVGRVNGADFACV